MSSIISNYEIEAECLDSYPMGEYKKCLYALGLCGEAGEIADKIKKVYRDTDGKTDWHVREDIGKELGDVLWYLTRLANAYGFSLEGIMAMNLQKLQDRKERGKIGGSGDNR